MGNATHRSPVKNFRNAALKNVRIRMAQIMQNANALNREMNAITNRMRTNQINERNVIRMHRIAATLNSLHREHTRLSRFFG